MTSISESSHQQSEHMYSDDAVKLVVDSYNDLLKRLESAIKRGEYPRGTFFSEVAHKFTTAPFMDAQKLEEFRSLAQAVTADEVVRALWVILENNCNDRRLLPYLTVERTHGRIVAVLR